MQANTCMIDAWPRTWIWCSRHWRIRPGGSCSTGCTSGTARPWASCAASLAMARQSASQHLGLLEAANLVSTTWHGREKLHYLNPVPLHDMQERWIDKFERPRLRALGAIRHSAEEQAMTDTPTYVYVTYIKATPEQVWRGTHRRRPHRPLLGPPQRVRLAAGLDLAARPHRRLRHLRRHRHGARGAAAGTARASRSRARRSSARTLAGDLHDRAAPGHRPADRAARRPPDRGRRPGHLRAAGRPSWPTSSRCWRPARCSPRRRGRCTQSCARPRWRRNDPS